ncbi:MAG: type II and III secretion system protein family protein [Stellaceae bacterium]
MRMYSRFLMAMLALAGALPLVVAPLAAAPKVITTAGAPLVVEVGKGQLVHLDHPAATVFVADPDVADVQVKSPVLIYLFGKSGGETTLYAVGENDDVVLNVGVSVRYDITRVEEAIHQMAPRSAVAVRSVDDALVLEGTVYSAAEGDDIRRVAQRFIPDPKQLVNRLKLDVPNQVNIRVRVAEVSRNIVKEFGVNWDNIFKAGSATFGLATGPNATTIPGLLGTDGAFNTRTLSANGTTTVNNIFGGGTSGNYSLSALIDALDNQGLITVLAEPNLTAVSGEPASFLAGGEFPVPVSSAVTNGVAQITVEWKKFGVSLNFVGTITGGSRISLRVMPEVSQLSTTGAVTINGITIPALTTRRADTTVELASGQSFAIAGLIQNNITQNLDKFPWLGDVPVLGQLFRSDQFQRNETELVVIVTPYVVRPVATANRLMAPTDGFVPSSDKNLVLYGEEYKPQVLKAGAAPVSRTGTGLIGPSGFDLE